MPIAIGQKLESDFRDPLGLLGDCHRRIERFLDCLISISEDAQGQKFSELQRQQFETALRYFREAAPKHTLDEEQSLFPCLRSKEGDENYATFALLDGLHIEHEEAEIKHRRVDELGRAWLANEPLSPENTQMLIGLVKDLRRAYEKHIAVEDNEVFPLAGRILSPPELETIGREMAARRGLII